MVHEFRKVNKVLHFYAEIFIILLNFQEKILTLF